MKNLFYRLSKTERILGDFIVRHRKDAQQALSNKNIDWWKDMVVQLEVTPGHDKQKFPGVEKVVQLARAVCADDVLIQKLESWTLPVFPVKGFPLTWHSLLRMHSKSMHQKCGYTLGSLHVGSFSEPSVHGGLAVISRAGVFRAVD
ncbi:hypothetical protein Y032_0089g2249 [Ancylostoma ceylanicum]|uniref:Uncharacterized protein n=1 Tax=Ancylostoma ceylanicum TaxID=53326 RepID=A0A016TNW7_9BILA|nr:hypothetical protein Y032_0089g2249 [Ancylostoma ceylanicum]